MVTFLDANGYLGTGAIGPVTLLDRWLQTGLPERDTSGTVPVGTRFALVTVTFTDCDPLFGNYNNAYADNLSFTVSESDRPTSHSAPPNSNVRELDHVFVVYMENNGVDDIVGSPNARYLNRLINAYGSASNYYALSHPSDPTTGRLIGGSDFGISYNCASNCFDERNLADDIEAAGKTWVGYRKDVTDVAAHTPFAAFSDIINDPQRIATHLFDLSQMAADLASAATTPNFVWFAPDDATNMEGPSDDVWGALQALIGQAINHQYNVAAGDKWLQQTLPIIFNSEAWNTQKCAIVITFDEDYDNLSLGIDNQGNHIPTIVIPSQGAVAAGMRPGHFVATDHYDHYSLLRTLEESLGLPAAGQSPLTNNDKFAQPLNEFWV